MSASTPETTAPEDDTGVRMAMHAVPRVYTSQAMLPRGVIMPGKVILGDGFVTGVSVHHDLVVVIHVPGWVSDLTCNAALFRVYDAPLMGTVFEEFLAQTPEAFRNSLPLGMRDIATPHECMMAHLARDAMHRPGASTPERQALTVLIKGLTNTDQHLLYGYGFVAQAIGDAIIQHIAEDHDTDAYSVNSLVDGHAHYNAKHAPKALQAILARLTMPGGTDIGTIFQSATLRAHFPYHTYIQGYHAQAITRAHEIMQACIQTDTAYDPTTLMFVTAFNALLALATEGPDFAINEIPTVTQQEAYREYIVQVNKQCVILTNVAKACV